jgi:hypothetical protein
MKKDHPWSRAEEIVASRHTHVQFTFWKSAFHQTTRIALEKSLIPRYVKPRAGLPHRRERATDFNVDAFCRTD